ncbi:HepT-like ribonuclease domain-containing protein [Paraburkholderia oxyphila]|uniref:HepT-like ribonuclease domain-containing protein n=1 Tax=Paraburkholderia oxyphila TaxID=614212 RepID=UPI001428C2DE|nr:HepT-like ribonuclease domain-containing protein [Paraburkholderia oxyphila]
MLKAIERVHDYTESVTLETFQASPMMCDAVARNLNIIGEAARRVKLSDAAFMTAHPEIPWLQMEAMGERVTHDYFNITAKTIWATVQCDLPALERDLRSLKSS